MKATKLTKIAMTFASFVLTAMCFAAPAAAETKQPPELSPAEIEQSADSGITPQWFWQNSGYLDVTGSGSSSPIMWYGSCKVTLSYNGRTVQQTATYWFSNCQTRFNGIPDGALATATINYSNWFGRQSCVGAGKVSHNFFGDDRGNITCALR